MATHRARPLGGPSAWHGAELATCDRWRLPLDGDHLRALDEALAASANLPLEALTREAFPLASVRPVLEHADHELTHGTGVVKLEGIPVERYTEETLRRLLIGIGTHLGRVVPQNGGRGTLRAICDRSSVGGSRVDSAAGLNWHNDRADRVALLCVRPAASGGVSRLASATAIHDAMLARAPELLDALLDDFPRYAPGDELAGAGGIYATPVFRVDGTDLTTHYSRTYIEQATRVAGAAPLTCVQVAALDRLVSIADELAFHMRLAPGDVQVLNNHRVLHGRTAFEDEPGSGNGRLLYRLWLSTEGARGWSA